MAQIQRGIERRNALLSVKGRLKDPELRSFFSSFCENSRQYLEKIVKNWQQDAFFYRKESFLSQKSPCWPTESGAKSHNDCPKLREWTKKSPNEWCDVAIGHWKNDKTFSLLAIFLTILQVDIAKRNCCRINLLRSSGRLLISLMQWWHQFASQYDQIKMKIQKQ